MKNVKTNFRMMACLIVASFLVLSCNKDNNSSASSEPISDDDVSTSITEAVVPSSGGMVAQTNEAVVIVNTSSLDMNCGDTKDTAISFSGSTGDSVSYSYNLNVTSTLNCNNGIPQSFYMSFDGSNSYTSPRISSTDSASGSWNVTGIQASSSSYVFNETYKRSGTQASKIRYDRSISSTISITTSDLTLNKSTGKIVSGTATVSYSGTAGSNSLSRGGTLTFLGSDEAKLVLDDGNSM